MQSEQLFCCLQHLNILWILGASKFDLLGFTTNLYKVVQVFFVLWEALWLLADYFMFCSSCWFFFLLILSDIMITLLILTDIVITLLILTDIMITLLILTDIVITLLILTDIMITLLILTDIMITLLILSDIMITLLILSDIVITLLWSCLFTFLWFVTCALSAMVCLFFLPV